MLIRNRALRLLASLAFGCFFYVIGVLDMRLWFGLKQLAFFNLGMIFLLPMTSGIGWQLFSLSNSQRADKKSIKRLGAK